MATVHSQKDHSVRIQEKKAVIQDQEESVLLTEDHLAETKEKDFQEAVRKETAHLKRNPSKEDHLAKTKEEALPVAAARETVRSKRNHLTEDRQEMTGDQEQLAADHKAIVRLKENLLEATESHSAKIRERDAHTATTESPEDHLRGHSLTARTRRSPFVLTREEATTEDLRTVVQMAARIVTGHQKSM